jgi:hypothetical protein
VDRAALPAPGWEAAGAPHPAAAPPVCDPAAVRPAPAPGGTRDD